MSVLFCDVFQWHERACLLYYQDQCAWAIGNLAGGNTECREILQAQGSVPPLINLLKVCSLSLILLYYLSKSYLN